MSDADSEDGTGATNVGAAKPSGPKKPAPRKSKVAKPAAKAVACKPKAAPTASAAPRTVRATKVAAPQPAPAKRAAAAVSPSTRLDSPSSSSLGANAAPPPPPKRRDMSGSSSSTPSTGTTSSTPGTSTAAKSGPTASTQASPPPSSGGTSAGGSSTLPLLASVLAVIIAVTTPAWGPLIWGGEGKSSAVTKLEADQKLLIGSVAELSAVVTELSEGQAALNTSIRAVKVPAILIVADDLRQDIRSGGPFAEKLNLFRAIVGEDDPAMTSVYALDPWAEIGIPTDKDLQSTFEEVSQNVVAASQTIEAGGGDIARTISETMASLTAATIRLRWRLDGVPEDDGPLGIMARAEEMVRAGAFDLAIAEIEALPEAMKAKTESWVAAVKSRDLAVEAVADLDVYMIAAVARAQ